MLGRTCDGTVEKGCEAGIELIEGGENSKER